MEEKVNKSDQEKTFTGKNTVNLSTRGSVDNPGAVEQDGSYCRVLDGALSFSFSSRSPRACLAFTSRSNRQNPAKSSVLLATGVITCYQAFF